MRRKVITNLKTMLTFAQGQGLVAQNVARGIKIKTDKRSAPPKLKEGVDFPSKAEIRALLDGASDRWRAFFTVAIFTGLRASELRGLRWADIDLGTGTLTVSQRADAWRQIGAPKSAASKREIPLVPMAINALKQWRLECPAGELDLVFPNNAGRVDSPPNIQRRVWGPLQIECGLVDGSGPPPLSVPQLASRGSQLVHCAPGMDAQTAPGSHGACVDHDDVRSLRALFQRPGRRQGGDEET